MSVAWEAPSPATPPRHTRVAYITMAFPASSETFACADLRALAADGVDVSVHALRPPRPRPRGTSSRPWPWYSRKRAAAALLAERGLRDLAVTHGSLLGVARGLWVAARHPRLTLDLIGWAVRCSWRAPTHLVRSLALLPRSLDIFAALEASRPDVVHLFWGHYPAIVGYLVRRHLRDVILSVFLGAYDLERRYPGSAPVARAAHVVWTHARANADAIASLGVPRSRVRVLHRGIDVAAFSGGAVAKSPGRILTAGRLTPDKGMDDVLAAFAEVLARSPDASLTVLGDGPDRSRLVALAGALGIRGRVAFRGHVGEEQVRAEMAAAQVFVLLSRSPTERLPNVVKEAMASRCVCVVTETPGIRELLRDGTDGFVVAQGDVRAAARRIADVLQHPEAAAATATIARERIIAEFDVRRAMRVYQDGWQQLLRERLDAPGATVFAAGT